MGIARSSPNLVTLPDGRLFVLGDEAGDGGGYVSADSVTVELRDPASGAWKAGASLNKPRGQAVVIGLADGRVLVTGGRSKGTEWQGGESYSSTYIYDVGADRWDRAGLLGAARTDAAAVLLPDGRVLVAGGYFRNYDPEHPYGALGTELVAFRAPGETGRRGTRDDVEPPHVGYALATAEIFDPATGSWSSTGHLVYARTGASAVTLTDGRVLIVGSSPGPWEGIDVDERVFTTAEIYDPSTGRFTLTGSLPPIDDARVSKQLGTSFDASQPTRSANGTLVALPDGGAVLIGQADWWKHYADLSRSFRYDAGTARWQEIGPTYVSVRSDALGKWVENDGVHLSSPGAATLADGRVVVIGETWTVNGGHGSTAAVEAFDPARGSWSQLPTMPVGRMPGAVAALSDGSVLVVGGSTETTDGGAVETSSTLRLLPGS